VLIVIIAALLISLSAWRASDPPWYFWIPTCICFSSFLAAFLHEPLSLFFRITGTYTDEISTLFMNWIFNNSVEQSLVRRQALDQDQGQLQAELLDRVQAETRETQLATRSSYQEGQ